MPELKDAAIINSGTSRWHSYYLEGLAWVVRNVGIDGLYLEDLAFDCTTHEADSENTGTRPTRLRT